LCEPETEHTLKHREQRNNRGLTGFVNISVFEGQDSSDYTTFFDDHLGKNAIILVNTRLCGIKSDYFGKKCDYFAKTPIAWHKIRLL
jgi:hypothetical protein